MEFKLRTSTAPFVAPAPARWPQPFMPTQAPWQDSERGDAASPQRPCVLLVCGLARDGGEDTARTLRLVDLARAVFDAAGVDSEVLDLSRLSAELSAEHGAGGGRRGGVSGGPLMNDGPGLNQVLERGAAGWGRADGVLILTPAHWRRTSNVLQMMIARGVGVGLAAASAGGDEDEPEEAAWWSQQGAGDRAYGLVVHGDLHRALEVRRALCDWLDWMGLIDACEQARLDHFLGFDAPCDDLPAVPPEGEAALENEMRAAAWALVHAMAEIRAGRLHGEAPLLARAWPR